MHITDDNIINQVEKETKTLITLGCSRSNIQKSILHKYSDMSGVDNNLMKDVINTVCSEYPDYDIIQKIARSKIIQDIESEEEKYYLIDPKDHTTTPISRRILNSVMHQRYDLSSKIYTAKFVYNPFKLKRLYKDNFSEWVYNTYLPPKWQKDHFNSEGKVSVTRIEEVPYMYKKFFNHLVNNHKESYNYLLDWLANGVQDRNYCMLTTIGRQGIGKGILGKIMSHIFGEDNYNGGVPKTFFSSKFNSEILNKRLVYFDEVFIKTADEESRMKLLINDEVQVEKKGVDAQKVKNFANFYFSANNMDSIRIPGDDRRFSILELTDVKLVDVMKSHEIGELEDPKNVHDLACYLNYRKVDKEKMLRVFKSSRTDLVRSSSLKDWEEWILEDYAFDHVGEEVSIKRLGEMVAEEFNLAHRPGRTKFEELCNRFPEYVAMRCKKVKVKDGRSKREWTLEIKKTKE